MEETKKTEMQLVEEFYENKLFLSYSALSLLKYSPRAYYKKYVLKKEEDTQSENMLRGSLIHCLLLEPQNFGEKYVISMTKLPSDNIKLVVDRIWSENMTNKEAPALEKNWTLGDFPTEILCIMREINLYQSLKSDQGRLDKVLSHEANDYWYFLMQQQEKTLVTAEMYNECLLKAQLVKDDKYCSELLGVNITTFDENVEVHNELLHECDAILFPFGIKGTIDNVKIDHLQKKIFINDFKTSAKSISEFEESIELYNYWIQACMYKQLIHDKFKDLIGQDYTIEFRFIVIDKYDVVFPFFVSKTKFIEWYALFLNELSQAQKHYELKDYTKPFKYLNLVEAVL